MKETQVQFLGRREFPSLPWRRKWQPIPVFLPGESHGQRSLQVIVHGVARVRHDLATKLPPP